MFTGIIEQKGRVSSIAGGAVYKIEISAGSLAEKVKPGDSVSVNGVCLTATEIRGGSLFFDAVRETVRRTALSGLRPGDEVNLETALTLSKPLGGHFSSGHVDGTAVISRIRILGTSREIDFTCSREMLPYIAEKGSVAVDGISLTVAAVSGSGFSVAAIPHTLKNTTLPEKKEGDTVNIETDLLAKYLESLLKKEKKPSLEEALLQNGFK
ncbi:MAG: riboflavin synthase [Abditibacteriota bacterium]|nr:riboflavin synthase [Abditibacteriota bacterium]